MFITIEMKMNHEGLYDVVIDDDLDQHGEGDNCTVEDVVKMAMLAIYDRVAS